MATPVIMPQAGDGIEFASVVRWLKKPGEPVKRGEIICEVETEKIALEVAAPVDGFLTAILAAGGQQAPIFSPIALIGEKDEVIDVAAAVGSIEARRAAAVDASPATRPEPDTEPDHDRVRISPRAKRLATERGIPLALLTGSGGGGRITEADVLAFSGTAGAAESSEAPAPVAGGRRRAMTGMRAAIARKTQASKQRVPHFYVSVSVDMTAALRFLAEANAADAAGPSESLSVTDLVIGACAVALREFPAINSSVVDDHDIVEWAEINIGLVVGLDAGLMVPVLQNADTLSLTEIAAGRRRIVAAVQAGRPVAARGTFSISNLGMFGVEEFAAIINPPEAAILAVGGIQKTAVPLEDGTIGIRDMMKMTLSVDHRVVDGILGARFVNRVKACLQDPTDVRQPAT